MTTTIEDYLPVRARAQDLGCELSGGLVMLPENFGSAVAGDDLHFRSETSTVRKLLRAGGLEAERLRTDRDLTMFVHNRSYDWAVPAIFIGTEVLKADPDVVSVVIDLIRDHMKELFGGATGGRKVSLEVIVENGRGRCRKVRYEGDAAGLKEVERIVRSMR